MAVLVAAPSACTANPDASALEGSRIAGAAIAATAATPTGEFTLRLESGGQTVRADGAFRLGEHDRGIRLEMTGLPGADELGIVLVDDMVYVKLPPGQSLAAGKPWLSVPAHDDGTAASRLVPMLDRLTRSVDPTTNLEVLRDVATVEKRDAEQVDGVVTTPYAFALDVAEADMTTAVRELANEGVTRVDYTVWLDADSLPRRFELTQRTSSGQVSASGTYSHWGEPVDISAPGADETVAAGG